MLRKRDRKARRGETPGSPDGARLPAPLPPAAPVNVVVIVEPRRGRRPRRHDRDGEAKDGGHPLLKTALGIAVVKRLTRRRKRPLSKRVRTAVRKGRRKAKRVVRRARRALR